MRAWVKVGGAAAVVAFGAAAWAVGAEVTRHDREARTQREAFRAALREAAAVTPPISTSVDGALFEGRRYCVYTLRADVPAGAMTASQMRDAVGGAVHRRVPLTEPVVVEPAGPGVLRVTLTKYSEGVRFDLRCRR